MFHSDSYRITFNVCNISCCFCLHKASGWNRRMLTGWSTDLWVTQINPFKRWVSLAYNPNWPDKKITFTQPLTLGIAWVTHLYEDRKYTYIIIEYFDVDGVRSPSDRQSTYGYCLLIGGSLISWKGKKKDELAQSSADVKYRAIIFATYEPLRL